MPVPAHVFNLEDYWAWLDGLVGQSGGYLTTNVLIVEAEFDPEDDQIIDRLIVPPQLVTFADGTRLQMALTADENLVPLKYSFHYMDSAGRMIWRKDNVHKHRGHQDRAHIHLGPGAAHEFDDVDPDEVFREVAEYQSDRTMPVPK